MGKYISTYVVSNNVAGFGTIYDVTSKDYRISFRQGLLLLTGQVYTLGSNGAPRKRHIYYLFVPTKGHIY